MNICIFGAGAIGGHVGAKLLHAGVQNVSVVARGPALAAIRERGFLLRSEGKEFRGKPAVATDDPGTLPPQDIVLVTLKATAGLPAAAGAIARLIAPGGCAVFMTNGIPWWWRHGLPGKAETLKLLDPEAALWNAVKPGRVIGCVVYAPTEAVEPGVLVHVGQNHLVLGEPDGSSSERLAKVIELFKRAGIDARHSKDLRNDIWRKLTQNASGNTVCALTRTDLGGMGLDAGLRTVSIGIMNEVMAVASAQGWDFRAEVDCEAIAKRGKPGQKPSMLQDALAGRPMECEALLGQVQAFARELNIATPTADVVLPLLRGLDAALQRAK